MVNTFTDPKARKTPCSIALPNEMWEQIDQIILKKYNGRMSRSGFFEDYIRQILEEEGKDIVQDPGGIISVSTARSYITRIKDFVRSNKDNKLIGNLEAIRRDLEEANTFNNQEIRRSRHPSKADKKAMEFEKAVGSHLKAREEKDKEAEATPAPAQEETEEQAKPVLDPADLEYEQALKEAYTNYKEDPLPKPDYEIIDEGRTERNPYDKSGKEEVFK